MNSSSSGDLKTREPYLFLVMRSRLDGTKKVRASAAVFLDSVFGIVHAPLWRNDNA